MALRIAGIIFLAILLAACPKDSAHSDPRVGRAIAPISVAGAGDDAATTGSRTLSAALEFVRWDMREGRLYVDFLLKNESEGNVLVWECDEHAGYYDWTIELRNSTHDTIEFGGNPRIHFSNGASDLARELRPGEEYRVKCFLLLDDSNSVPGVKELDALSFDGVAFLGGDSRAVISLLLGDPKPEIGAKARAFFAGDKYELRGSLRNSYTATPRVWDKTNPSWLQELPDRRIWTGKIKSDWIAVELMDRSKSGRN